MSKTFYYNFFLQIFFINTTCVSTTGKTNLKAISKAGESEEPLKGQETSESKVRVVGKSGERMVKQKHFHLVMIKNQQLLTLRRSIHKNVPPEGVGAPDQTNLILL